LGYGPGKEFELRNAVERVLKDLSPPAPASTRAGAPVSPEDKVRLVVYPSVSGAGEVGVSRAPSSGTVKLSAGESIGPATKKVMPYYPPEAKYSRAQGTVQVEITVSESGKVIGAKAISGHELLRDAAVEAAKQWEFEPTEDSGAPVTRQGVLTFSFALQ
jgi:protein TonB